MQTLIIVATVVFGLAVMALFLLGREQHLLERLFAGKDRKGKAWNASSVVLEVERDAEDDVAGLVYSGFTRNPGRAASVGVVRRWQRDRERRDKWLHGVVWEHEARQIHELPFVRAGNTLCLVDYGLRLRGVEIESGRERWHRRLRAQPAAPLVLDADGSVLVRFADDSWLRVDPADGREVATGRSEQGSEDRADAGTGPAGLRRLDTHQAILGTMLAETAWLAPDQGSSGPGRALVVGPSSDARGAVRSFELSREPPPGRHLLELSGRKIVSDSFAVGERVLVFLTARESGQQRELFAEFVSIDDLESIAAIHLGWGSDDSWLDLAYGAGSTLVLRIGDLRREPTPGPSPGVTCILDPRLPRLLARIPGDGEAVELMDANAEAVWSGAL